MLHALRGFDTSFSWSLWGAKSLLLEGLKWRISDGVNIDVWNEAWIGENDATLESHSMEAKEMIETVACIFH